VFVTIVDADELDCGSESPLQNARLRLVAPAAALGRGDRVQFTAELAPVSLIHNLGLLSPLPRATSSGIVASGAASSLDLVNSGSDLRWWIDRARNYVRTRISATYSPRAEALARALVLGENDLDPDDDLAFRQSGLSHLLAVSGTHLVFAIVTWMAALQALMVRITSLSARWHVEQLIAPLGALCAFLYADFAGGSGSAWRAAWMLAAVYFGRCLGRKVGGLQALALSLAVGTLLDPWAGFDLSFLLSAAATLGLITFGQSLARKLNAIQVPALRAVALAASTTVCAMLPCIPILSLMAPDVTVAGVLANLFAGPLGEAASLPLCLVHAVAGVFPPLERGLALCASGALLLVAKIARVTAAVTWARVGIPYPNAAHFCVLALTALAVTRFASRAVRRVLMLIGGFAMVLVELATHAYGKPRDQLRITVNDVGQGDSLLVDFPTGQSMLVDGGGNITGGLDPGISVLQPLLRARRRRRVDVVVVTHPHPDHFGGLLTLLPTIDVGEVWMQEGTLPELRAALERRNVPVIGLSNLCAKPHWFGRVELRVLGPCPDASGATNVNNASIVMRVQMGQRVAILPGDAEHEAESELAARYANGLRADFLKVGHHGSRSSTSEQWVRLLHPRWAAISAGSRNRFGHPVPATEARLRNSGAIVLRTDELGSIQWQTDGTAVSLRTARAKVEVPLIDNAARVGPAREDDAPH
jgi:competence protein ComEC